MTPDKIEDYIEKVYGYAVHHTYSSDEADELSQEILYTAIRELPKLRDDSRFEPWLWGVAANVTKSFRRTMGKYRAVYSFDVPEDIPFYDSDDYESEKIFDALRAKIAMLSEIYRTTQYKYICVDEAQDLNYSQYYVIHALCGESFKNIMMVGDENQSIYRFNGSDSKLMAVEFVKDFSPTVFELNENFRCAKAIVNFANTLEQSNDYGILMRTR